MDSTPSPTPKCAPPTPGSRRGPRRPLLPCLCLGLLVFALSACRDSLTDPLEGLVAGETDRAALALELPLPTPLHEDPDQEPEAVATWRSSWARPVLEGRQLRQALYDELGRLMAARHTRSALFEEVALLGAGVRRAGELDTADLPEFLTAGIRRASESHGQAERAASAGNEETAWSRLLRGADALREVGPEAVARTAVAECEVLVRRIADDHSYSEKELERIRHLVRGSRQALESGDWGLAIRRAHYAEGLLAGNG